MYATKQQRLTEMTMRTISRARPAPQIILWQSWLLLVWASLTRWWSSYRAWHFERVAIRQLSSLSDRQLKDIGLDRSEIVRAVKSRPKRCPRFSRYY
jgi:uncharacterized protein YjiS (DUF1127 family)